MTALYLVWARFKEFQASVLLNPCQPGQVIKKKLMSSPSMCLA